MATLLQQQESLLDTLRVLNQHFPHDPEVLHVTMHAYSDLSTKRRTGTPTNGTDFDSLARMDAETKELQGKWDDAEKDYRKILDQNHAALSLSPDAPAAFQTESRADFRDVAKVAAGVEDRSTIRNGARYSG